MPIEVDPVGHSGLGPELGAEDLNCLLEWKQRRISKGGCERLVRQRIPPFTVRKGTLPASCCEIQILKAR